MTPSPNKIERKAPNKEASNSAENRSTSGFDLLTNPFVLLSVSPTATAQEIKQAHEDAVEDGIAPVDVLQRALQLLLTPKLRIEAEVGGFLDVNSHLSNQIIAKLRLGASWPQLAVQIGLLHALPRSNVLAHLGAKAAASVPQLMQLVEAQATVSIGGVYDAITEARELAGIGRIDRETVAKALTQLDERQTTAIVNRLTQETAYAATFAAFVSQVLASDDNSLVRKLDTYVHAYSHAAASELSRQREEVVVACDALRGDPDDEPIVDRIARALRNWNAVGQPLQAYESHLHRDDAAARELFLHVRELCLWLANEKGRYGVARMVASACAEAFKDLPRSFAQIQEDLEKLAELHKQQIALNLLAPLGQACEEAQQNPSALERELLSSGFGPNSRGIAGNLFKIFVEAVNSTKILEVSDLPWNFLRNVAISLNNDAKSPKAAAAVIDGLLAHVGVQRPSSAMVEFLESDERASRKNVIQLEFGNAISSDDLAKAAALLDELLTLEKDVEELATLHRLKSVLEEKRQSRRIKLALGGIAAAVVIVFILANQNNQPAPKPGYTPPSAPNPYPSPDTPPLSRPSPPNPPPPYNAPNPYRSPYNEPTVPRSLPTDPPTEERPRAGTDLTFTRSNLRYCKYQGVRLDGMRPMIISQTDINTFNSLIDDWNSRCGKYLYREGDKNAIDAEITVRRPALEAEGRTIVSRWQAERRKPR